MPRHRVIGAPSDLNTRGSVNLLFDGNKWEEFISIPKIKQAFILTAIDCPCPCGFSIWDTSQRTYKMFFYDNGNIIEILPWKKNLLYHREHQDAINLAMNIYNDFGATSPLIITGIGKEVFHTNNFNPVNSDNDRWPHPIFTLAG